MGDITLIRYFTKYRVYNFLTAKTLPSKRVKLSKV